MSVMVLSLFLPFRNAVITCVSKVIFCPNAFSLFFTSFGIPTPFASFMRKPTPLSLNATISAGSLSGGNDTQVTACVAFFKDLPSYSLIASPFLFA